MHKKKTTIVINTRFSACHLFAQAPSGVEYLKFPHRHEFHVTVEMEVFHDDRELEFILVKQSLDKYLSEGLGSEQMSCEMIASGICKFLKQQYGARDMICTVLEDGENGGKVYYGA